jgi:hypothetical protein
LFDLTLQTSLQAMITANSVQPLSKFNGTIGWFDWSISLIWRTFRNKSKCQTLSTVPTLENHYSMDSQKLVATLRYIFYQLLNFILAPSCHRFFCVVILINFLLASWRQSHFQNFN